MNKKLVLNKVEELIPELRFPEFEKKEEWEYVYGNKLFEPISNKNHNSDLPILAITQEQGAVPRDMINYRVSVAKKSVESYKIVEIGDFIISLRSFQGGIEYSNFKGLCSPAYIILRKKVDLENDYYRHYFKSVPFIRDLNRNLEGIRDGKMVSYQQFSEILIPKPTNEEQQKIASCLSSLDEVIEAHNQKLELLKNYKKGLVKNLFPQEDEKVPKFRFKEFKENGGWKKIIFNQAFKRVTRKNIQNHQNVLTISAQQGLIAQEQYFNKKIASKDITNYYLIKKGEFAYNKSYSKEYPKGAIKLLKKYDVGVVSTLYICFKCKEDFSCEYFEHFFESGIFNKQIDKIAQEGARDHGLLNVSVIDFFDSLEVIQPPTKEEQQKIASCLSALDEVITAQAEKIEQLNRHKKGLMQGLFPKMNN